MLLVIPDFARIASALVVVVGVTSHLHLVSGAALSPRRCRIASVGARNRTEMLRLRGVLLTILRHLGLRARLLSILDSRKEGSPALPRSQVSHRTCFFLPRVKPPSPKGYLFQCNPKLNCLTEFAMRSDTEGKQKNFFVREERGMRGAPRARREKTLRSGLEGTRVPALSPSETRVYLTAPSLRTCTPMARAL